MSAEPEVDVYAPPVGTPPRAAYIHVPFCLHRCGYCDFTLIARRDDLIPTYLAALANELNRLDQLYEVDTIYIGGGTPTHLSPQDLESLLNLIATRFILATGGEYSIEANPDGLDDDRLQVLADRGVNRLSLGVQSFDNAVLKTLERQHTGDEAVEVVNRAVAFIPNISLDLIFGVPGQSQQSLQSTLSTAMSLPLKHISTYGLTFEKGTSFFQRLQHGDLHSIPDDVERDMYADVISTLSEHDFAHYEISNFSRPGFESRHNMTYWAAKEYFAFGPGAARYVNGIRSTNARSVSRWLKAWTSDEVALQEWEQLDDAARVREAVFLGLRRISGINVTDFKARFLIAPQDVEPEATAAHIDNGLLEIHDGWMRLTDEGRFIADSVVVDFL